jgi:acetyl esterase/lipase
MISTCCLLLSLAAGAGAIEREEDIVYGRRDGTALTLDVIRPAEGANGIGLVWVVSGGWFSAREAIMPPFVQPFTDRGFTVFAVVHRSQPRFTIPDAIEDLDLAVRFIRHRAGHFKIDPDRIGIFGASAGGHLSLMQATASSTGDPDSKDPLRRASGRVQAVACFFPPTDFLNYGRAGESALGVGTLAILPAPFDFRRFDPQRKVYVSVTDEAERREIGRQISPLNHVTPDDPPALIFHGDADQLVPIQQATLIVDKFREQGVECELVIRPGAGHGWPTLGDDLHQMAEWFEAMLHNKP